ncbi:flavodoxin-dependent (E)-4-hydroxy-3-methylbut-2-enyl-diphosphate synthase, partial [Anaerotruncus sp. AF02-27]|uniref:flavodoxin-dependent (E)-4-hydroxy-3-methylbut-2-enyl-diphosphate synthase n=1 Tax=Anaerotruncus sp. AF02-27 TaxID=2292191 RepID=UPI001FA8ED73
MSRTVKIGNLTIGGGNRVAIQSMLNTRADDISGSVAQAKALEAAGCEILRMAVPEISAVKLVEAVKEAVSIPLVADIHFDYRIALACVCAGIDKIRINP